MHFSHVVPQVQTAGTTGGPNAFRSAVRANRCVLMQFFFFRSISFSHENSKGSGAASGRRTASALRAGAAASSGAVEEGDGQAGRRGRHARPRVCAHFPSSMNLNTRIDIPTVGQFSASLTCMPAYCSQQSAGHVGWSGHRSRPQPGTDSCRGRGGRAVGVIVLTYGKTTGLNGLCVSRAR